DGTGMEVRLQHALGVAFHQGKLYVADTYNSKIKEIDPARQSCVTVLGGKTAAWATGTLFSEPGGLSFTGDKLYVADTNNHRIRVVDLKTHAVSTLRLQGVEAPRTAPEEADRLVFPNPTRDTLPLSAVAAEGDLTLDVELRLAPGLKLDPQSQINYRIETLGHGQGAWSA